MALYDEYAMRTKVDECLKTVAVVLDNNKAATIAAADRVSHQYEDKYLLANNLTNMSIACILNALELMGVSDAQLCSLKAWNTHRAVALKTWKILPVCKPIWASFEPQSRRSRRSRSILT